MNTNKIKEAIEARTNASVLINEPMSKHTSMRIGGNAKIFVSIYKEEDLKALKKFITELKTVKKIEILPYHDLGKFKWTELGCKYELEGVPTANSKDVNRAKQILGI